MPDVISYHHDQMIFRYLERGSKVLLRTGLLYFPMLNKKGFIIKVINFSVNLFYILDKYSIYFEYE
jgi:hypothetical protein